VFGPREHDVNAPDRVELNMSIFRAFDDNSRFITDVEVSDATLQAQRWYEGVNANLAYRRTRPTSLIAVDATSNVRQYAGLGATGREQGTVGADLQPARRVRLQLNGVVGYSPYYQVIPGSAAIADAGSTLDYAVLREPQ